MLPQTKLAQSLVGKKTGAALGRKYGPLNEMSKICTTAGCKLGAKIGGPIGRHVFWHRRRLLFNPVCEQCQEAQARKENWWTAV